MKASRKKKFIDSLLDTLCEWKGTTRDGRLLDVTLPSGRISVDFMKFDIEMGKNETSAWPLADSRTKVESAKRLTVGPGAGAGERIANVAEPEPVRISDENRRDGATASV